MERTIDNIDREVSNLCDRKLWDIIRLSNIISTDPEFLLEVHAELARRNCAGEAHKLHRYLFSSSLVDEYGRESPITEAMIEGACRQVGQPQLQAI